MASLVIVNGKVWGHRGATALAITGDRIVGVGLDRDMPAAERRWDAEGATILPAFNDAHVHFLMGSRGLGHLDLSGLETQAAVEAKILDFASASRSPWLIGRGWLYSAFPGGMPTRELLDRLVPDRPAYMESFDTHCAWVNSHALATAGLAERAGDGVLKERDMDDFIARHLPKPSHENDLESLRAGLRLAASRGVGSVQEASRGLDLLPLLADLEERDELTLRARLAFDMVPGLPIDDWEERLVSYEDARHSIEPGRISTGILKAFADGVVESKTAALLEPYEGSSEKGDPIWERGELRAAVAAADRRGWQVEVHAIGDAAIRQSLDAFEDASPGRRHRIEHIELPEPSDIPRFARLGVVASMQPQHADQRLTEVWRRHLGPDRAARGWPWAELLRSGAHVAFGTDWPVVGLDPFAGLHEAARTIGLASAVDRWTSGSAYAEHAEHEKGTLRDGMLADVAVVDLEASTVHATIVGGRVVYEV